MLIGFKLLKLFLDLISFIGSVGCDHDSRNGNDNAEEYQYKYRRFQFGETIQKLGIDRVDKQSIVEQARKFTVTTKYVLKGVD